MISQREERPRGLAHLWFTRNTVDQWVPAIPAPSGRHTVIQHGLCKLNSTLNLGGQRRRWTVAQGDERYCRGLYPTRSSSGPTPTVIVIVLGNRAPCAAQLSQDTKPSPRFPWSFVGQPAYSMCEVFVKLRLRIQSQTGKRSDPTAF